MVIAKSHDRAPPQVQRLSREFGCTLNRSRLRPNSTSKVPIVAHDFGSYPQTEGHMFLLIFILVFVVVVVFVCVFAFECICMHVYVHVYTCMLIFVHMHTYICTFIFMCILAFMFLMTLVLGALEVQAQAAYRDLEALVGGHSAAETASQVFNPLLRLSGDVAMDLDLRTFGIKCSLNHSGILKRYARGEAPTRINWCKYISIGRPPLQDPIGICLMHVQCCAVGYSVCRWG